MIQDRLKALDWSLILFVVLAVALSLFLWETTGEVEAANMIINIVLTGFLIWIYQGIANSEESQAELQEQVVDIQEQQADILDRQEEWMEAGHKPVIQVEDVRIVEEHEDRIQIVCSNQGNGVAKNLAIACSVQIPNEEYYGGYPLHKPLNERSDLPESLRELADRDNPLRKATGNIRTHQGVSLSPAKIEALETDIAFSRVQNFGLKGEEGIIEMEVEFQQLVDLLRSEDISRFSFAIILRYEDILGRKEEQRLFQVYEDVTDELTFFDAVKSHFDEHRDDQFAE